MKKENLEEVMNFISRLEEEANACEEIGSNFSASSMRAEANRLKRLVKKGIIPTKELIIKEEKL